MGDPGFALYSYHTWNIGDEIQSIAASRFLPRVDYYIDRDRISRFSAPDNQAIIKLIANGWYMQAPYGWPPRDTNIKPLLVSMFLNSEDPTLMRTMLSPESRAFFSQYGAPVGARDKATAALLKHNGIDSYWSGCMTLTLQRESAFPRAEFVLAVDVSDAVYEQLRAQTVRPVLRLTPAFTADLTRAERFALARYYLYLYQTAHAVISTRLHAVLPCTALGTPVLLVKRAGKYQTNRYAGLEDFVRQTWEQDFLLGRSGFDIDDPGPNPTHYLTKRDEIAETARQYTGYDSALHGAGCVPLAFATIGTDPALVSAIAKAMAPVTAKRSWTVAQRRIQEMAGQPTQTLAAIKRHVVQAILMR